MKRLDKILKKLNFKNTMLFIIFLSIILFFIIILFIFCNKKTDIDKDYRRSNIIIFTSKDKYKDAEIITNETLKSEHCVDKVCVKDLVIYKAKTYYNIEMKIKNKSKKEASGYLKVIFKDREMTIFYNKLKSNKEKNYTIQLGERGIDDPTDFKVRKLTDKELKKLVK